MDPFPILLMSNVRPSRAWKLANRIAREVPGANICGIVQRDIRQLPFAQQLIATGSTHQMFTDHRRLSKANLWFQSVVERALDWAVWWVHGCPRTLMGTEGFTLEKLAEACVQA